jgi:hypothetical protein
MAGLMDLMKEKMMVPMKGLLMALLKDYRMVNL